MIYHITLSTQWADAQEHGVLLTESLSTEGFIHCSEAPQVERSLNRFFSLEQSVVVLHVDPERLVSELKYESAHGELFPHIYGPLNLDAVVGQELILNREGSGFHYPSDGA